MPKEKSATNSSELVDKGLRIILVILIAAAGLWLGFHFVIRPNLPPGWLDKITNDDSRLDPETNIPTVGLKKLNLNSTEPAESQPDFLPPVDYQDIRVILGGDVMLSRYVGRAAEQAKDYRLPWAEIKQATQTADISLINLEAPFAESGPYYVADDSLVFKTDPRMLAGLTTAGIDGVSLANNHILNQGADNVEYTKKLLTANQINYSHDQPAWFIIKRGPQEIKIALLAYAYDQGLDAKKLTADLSEVKLQEADIIIVSLHAGSEYTNTPSTQQQEFARAAIDGGANIVWGHHPHVVQPMERYKDGYIFYSLGNLIFDQAWSEATTKGLLVNLIFSLNNNLQLKQIELLPVKIEDNFQPRLMTPDEGREILDILGVEDYIINMKNNSK